MYINNTYITGFQNYNWGTFMKPNVKSVGNQKRRREVIKER